MEKFNERITDMELALNLAYHIENPCQSEVKGVKVTCLESHLKLAKITLPKLSNLSAKKFLEYTIKRYS